MTDEIEVEIKPFWGAHLLVAEDDAGHEHHWWIDTTESGIPLVFGEVVLYDEGERHYVPNDKIEVPPLVRDAIKDYWDVDTVRLGHNWVK